MKKNMLKKQWTVKEWEQNCLINCTDSYSFAVNLVALAIKQFGSEKEGLKIVNGLSGFQAETAIMLAKQIPDSIFEKIPEYKKINPLKRIKGKKEKFGTIISSDSNKINK